MKLVSFLFILLHWTHWHYFELVLVLRFLWVNRELKLLVASVGDDLQYHFERVAREKNQLILENEALGGFAQLSEQLERMSIQCDVWRSKFASRYFLFYFLVFALPDLLALNAKKKKKWLWSCENFWLKLSDYLIHYLGGGLSLLWMVIQ